MRYSVIALMCLGCLGCTGCAGLGPALAKGGQVFADGVQHGTARAPDATVRVER